MADFVLSARLEAEADGLIAETGRASGSVDGLTREIRESGPALKGTAKATDAYARATREAARSAQTLTRSTAAAQTSMQRAGGGYRQMGFAAQQAGYQVGDFAVQVSSGTPVMRALIQQGTQMVSMFGPMGAVIGAVGAILGGTAVAFLDMSSAAEKAAKAAGTVSEALDRSEALIGENSAGLLDLARSFGEADAAQRRFIEADFVSTMARNRIAIEEQIRALAALGGSGLALGSVFQTAGRADRGDGPRIEGLDGVAAGQARRLYDALEAFERDPGLEGLEALGRTISTLTIELDGSSDAFTDFAEEMLPAIEEAIRLGEVNETLEQTLESLRSGVEGVTGALNTGARSIARYGQGVNSLTTGQASPESAAYFAGVEMRLARERIEEERLEKQGEAIEALRGRLDPAHAAAEQLREEFDLIGRAVADGQIGAGTAETLRATLQLQADIASGAIDPTAGQGVNSLTTGQASPENAAYFAGVEMRLARETRVAEEHKATVSRIRQASLALLPVYDRMKAEADAWRDQALAGLDEQADGYQAFADEVKRIYDRQIAEARQADLEASRAWEAGVIRGLRNYADAATDAASSAERAVTGSFKSMEDALVGFVTTGRFEFSSLIDSIIADMARAAVQQNVTGPLSDAAGGFLSDIVGGLFHGGGMGGSPALTRAVDPRLFLGAPRYHTGYLNGDETAAILRKDEGVFTPRQMDNADQLLSIAMTAATRPMPAPEIHIHTPPGTQVREQQSEGRGGRPRFDFFIEQVDQALAQRADVGASQFGHVLAKRHGLSRGAAARSR